MTTELEKAIDEFKETDGTDFDKKYPNISNLLNGLLEGMES